jgi:ATP-dependent RNA helicase DeaD
VSGREIYQLRDIQKFTKTKIEQHKIPSLADVEEIRTDKFLEKVKSVINNADLTKYIHLVEGLMEEDYTSVETSAALLKIFMSKDNGSEEESFGDTGASQGMVRFFINVGRKQRIKAKDIVKGIAEETGLSSQLIGKIDIFDKFSFVEIPESNAKEFLSLMNRGNIKGKSVNVEPANRKN